MMMSCWSWFSASVMFSCQSLYFIPKQLGCQQSCGRVHQLPDPWEHFCADLWEDLDEFSPRRCFVKGDHVLQFSLDEVFVVNFQRGCLKDFAHVYTLRKFGAQASQNALS